MVASRPVESPTPSPGTPAVEPPREVARGAALAALGAVAVALVALEPVLPTLGAGLWGPENAWHNRDFLGAWWLFWDAATAGDGLALQNWPDGALPLQHHIPNPFDGWLLGPLVWDAPFPAWWNGMQLGHHLLNVAMAAVLARCAGGRTGDALAAAALVAASPVMLHEIAGGRTLSGAVWPGLLGLALLLRGQGVLAGLLLGVQGLCYLYAGALFGLVALLLRPSWGLMAAAVPLVPYAAWLSPLVEGLHGKPPPAGFSELPLAGLVGAGAVPERFRLHPALLAGMPGFVWLAVDGDRRRAARWLVGTALVGLVALGPQPGWGLDDDTVTSPLAWALWAIPGLGRMHHPVRAALLLAPLLAVGVALLLRRMPTRLGAVPVVLALFSGGPVQRAAGWGIDPVPPGVDAARWLAQQGDGAVLDLTGAGDAALGLQPLHGKPMLEGLRRPMPKDRADGPRAPRLRKQADAWLRSERAPSLPGELSAAGFRWVLVVDRQEPPIDRVALEADLGAPVVPDVYALP